MPAGVRQRLALSAAEIVGAAPEPAGSGFEVVKGLRLSHTGFQQMVGGLFRV